MAVIKLDILGPLIDWLHKDEFESPFKLTTWAIGAIVILFF